MNNFYVSSVAFSQHSAEEMLDHCVAHDIQLEFSSGLPYRADMSSLFLKYPLPKLAHNYFPAPRAPFVVNLASRDEMIRKRSIVHCIQGLELTKAARAPFFAAHAGFCIDPDPQQLGQQLTVDVAIDKDLHWSLFLKSVREILGYAHALGVDFYIENNVLAPFNVMPSGECPLLCCDAAEMVRLLEEVADDRLGLLLDTAHLKVSAHTFGESLAAEMAQLQGHIHAVHHSDNDGTRDNNEPIGADYWFLPYMADLQDVVHVLEVKRQTWPEIEAQRAILFSA